MTNYLMSTNTETQDIVDTHVVEVSYFIGRVHTFESKYHEEFPGGWGEFFADFLNGKTDKGNLDYDEWGFLCEHFMKELTQSPFEPPGDCADSQEKPEAYSGFFFCGRSFVRSESIFRETRRNACWLPAL